VKARRPASETMNISATTNEDENLRAAIETLRIKHRELDSQILAIEGEGPPRDMLTVRRLKKQKLALKDRIRLLEDRLLPDIIA
jgi:hypothetical protein